jgi:hypothetical protein
MLLAHFRRGKRIDHGTACLPFRRSPSIWTTFRTMPPGILRWLAATANVRPEDRAAALEELARRDDSGTSSIGGATA